MHAKNTQKVFQTVFLNRCTVSRCLFFVFSYIFFLFQLQLNGYLLRKFKNSDGWQKLWVVFTNFCLFFFKNNTENAPLACLPLIGYRVSVPSVEDNILKDHVFKLHFKSHLYFFRTDSQFTFSRFVLDVISRKKTLKSYLCPDFFELIDWPSLNICSQSIKKSFNQFIPVNHF